MFGRLKRKITTDEFEKSSFGNMSWKLMDVIYSFLDTREKIYFGITCKRLNSLYRKRMQLLAEKRNMIEKLPMEIHQYICSFLGFKDVVNYFQVSKRINRCLYHTKGENKELRDNRKQFP